MNQLILLYLQDNKKLEVLEDYITLFKIESLISTLYYLKLEKFKLKLIGTFIFKRFNKDKIVMSSG